MKSSQILILAFLSLSAATSPSAAVNSRQTQTAPPVRSEIECGCEDNPTLDTLAIVNGVKIRNDDLSPDTRSRIRLLQDTVIEARSRELDKVIASNLLEA